MVQANYNPFREKEIIETEHGVINLEKRRYITHRKPEHYFKKFGGFGISKSEIEMCVNYRVDEIAIKYHGHRKNLIYAISMEYIKHLQTYDNDGDVQLIFPIKHMNVIGEELVR